MAAYGTLDTMANSLGPLGSALARELLALRAGALACPQAHCSPQPIRPACPDYFLPKPQEGIEESVLFGELPHLLNRPAERFPGVIDYGDGTRTHTFVSDPCGFLFGRHAYALPAPTNRRPRSPTSKPDRGGIFGRGRSRSLTRRSPRARSRSEIAPSASAANAQQRPPGSPTQIRSGGPATTRRPSGGATARACDRGSLGQPTARSSCVEHTGTAPVPAARSAS